MSANSLEEILQKVVDDEGLDPNWTKDVEDVNKEGFMGNVTKIVLKGKSKNGEEKTLRLVVKIATKNEVVRSKCLTRDLFVREAFMYSTIFPAMYSLQKEKNVKDVFVFSAKSLQYSLKEEEEIVILHDLTEDGFAVYNKRVPMTEDHVKMVMESYGKYHAFSLALQEQKPELYRKFASNLDNLYLKQNELSGLPFILKALLTDSKKCLDPDQDRRYFEVFSKFCETSAEYFLECIRKETDVSVILHGDCWTNNMMFKYADPNQPQTPTEMRFVDYQFARLGNPILDLSFYIYCCAPEDVLNNIENYLELYHETLCATLKTLGCSTNMFPLETVMKIWKNCAGYGLALSSFLFFLSLADPDELHDMNNVSDEQFDDYKNPKKFANKHVYLQRMRVNIKQCVEKNYI